jgi:transcriptional regulator with XRE-family HTH domain
MTTGFSPEGTTTATAALGTLIRGHRLRIGLTQRELADLSTISVRAIRDLEKGKALRPRAETIRLIADGLRLGPRARTALEEAVRRGHHGGGTRQPLLERCAPPAPLHPLIGRRAEAAVLAEELRSGAERLVTVVGLSGVGKTRLALETAARLHDAGFPVLWHTAPGAVTDSLPPDDDPLLALTTACAAHLQGPGSRQHPGAHGTGAGADAPVSADEQPPAALLAALGDRDALLVLDGAAPARLDFPRLTRLLRELPGLRVLLTADTPWDVPGERLFLLAPLDAPRPDDPARADAPAVRFLLGRIRQVRPDIVPDERTLADVAWVAHRLDGHPLALAAAASWLTVCDLSTLRGIVETDPAALLDHLADGRSGSHLRDGVLRTLAQLPPGPRELVARLCAADGDDFDLDEIVRLTGRSLPDCGRMVRALLIGGVIRPGTDHGRSAFRVLRVVRALAARPEAGPPAHAASRGPSGCPEPRGSAASAVTASAAA